MIPPVYEMPRLKDLLLLMLFGMFALYLAVRRGRMTQTILRMHYDKRTWQNANLS